MFECEILADSVSEAGARLTTFLVTYPRFIHAEMMTHRWFSRNGASSRAIPAAVLRQRVIDDPAVPVEWGSNQRGMQAGKELEYGDFVRFTSPSPMDAGQTFLMPARKAAEKLWHDAKSMALQYSEQLSAIGLHKQIPNRIIEPFMGITLVISATQWDGFWRQRCHEAAEPNMRHIAEIMRAAYTASTPKLLHQGEWHLPFITPEEHNTLRQRLVEYSQENQHVVWRYYKELSTARCAAISYLKHNTERPDEDVLRVYSKMTSSEHWSPFEHVATPMHNIVPLYTEQALTPGRCGNFIGWYQHRAEVDPHFGT